MQIPSIFRKRHPPVGARPGTLMVREGGEPTTMQVICYGPDGLDERTVATVAELDAALAAAPGRTAWIDVHGLGDERLLWQLAERFGIHALALEDVVNVPQRPKVDSYDAQLLVVTRMVRLVGKGELESEQVSLVVDAERVITFQEHAGDVFDPVRIRLREAQGRIRGAGAGYLAYALIDTIVDGYYPVLDDLADRLLRLEASVVDRPGNRTLGRLNHIKSQLALLRRGLWPQREAIMRLVADGGPAIPGDVTPFLRDTLDHSTQLVEAVDSHRELVNGLLNTYLSVVGVRTNEVMKVLTIMASIFIPLTFLVGVYGMNFTHMPEVDEPSAFWVLMGLMAAIAVGMLVFFRRKGWLGGDDDDDEP